MTYLFEILSTGSVLPGAGSAVKMNGLSRLGEKKKKKSTSGMVLKRPKMPFKKQV